jgi:hypothetical protein
MRKFTKNILRLTGRLAKQNRTAGRLLRSKSRIPNHWGFHFARKELCLESAHAAGKRLGPKQKRARLVA